jgi:hypothetical protein
MRRREIIALLGGAATLPMSWPLAVRAQTSRRLGLLFATSAQAAKARGLLEAVTQGLKEYGWVEGQNITIEYRFADGKADALPKLTAELVQLRVDAILTDSTPATQAANQAYPIARTHQRLSGRLCGAFGSEASTLSAPLTDIAACDVGCDDGGSVDTDAVKTSMLHSGLRGYEGAASTDHDQRAQAVGLFLTDVLLQFCCVNRRSSVSRDDVTPRDGVA